MQVLNPQLYSSDRSAKQSADYSFSLQYTALILIVLTFVIGAFLKPSTVVTGSHYFESEQPEIPKSAVRKAGAMSYKDLFLARSSDLNETVSGALVEFLSNHDVIADIYVYGSGEATPQSSDDAITLALARSTELFLELGDSGVPLESIRVIALPQGTNQAEVTLFRTQNESE